MAKKSMAGTTAAEWRAHTVEFRYKGKQYNAPIESNLVLNDLSVGEIKDHLNEVPGRLSYWSDMKIVVEREIADLEENFELWFQERYMEVDAEYGKRTEGWKKSKVMLENVDQYRTRRGAIRDLQDVAKKIGVLTSGYNTQTWTLREIARLTYQEMGNIELRGRGSLSDIK
jgi:hypothetical protein